MAKDTFYRTKPQVNVGAIFGLRKLAAEILEDAASGLPTGKRQHKQYSITKPMKPLVFARLRRLGISAQGIQQIALGQGVTDPEDRGLLCEVLMEQAHRELNYYKITIEDGTISR